MNTRMREWSKLPFSDPEPILCGLREIAKSYPLHEMPYEFSSLRRRDLRTFAEGRQAALFCFAMSQVMGTAVWFAQTEASDYDVVARYVCGDTTYFAPVQLKELVPERVNPNTDLQAELDKLNKYADSADLNVAIHLNSTEDVQPSQLKLPYGKVNSLWFYGAMCPDQSRWLVMGNLLAPEPGVLEFAYPGA